MDQILNVQHKVNVPYVDALLDTKVHLNVDVKLNVLSILIVMVPRLVLIIDAKILVHHNCVELMQFVKYLIIQLTANANLVMLEMLCINACWYQLERTQVIHHAKNILVVNNMDVLNTALLLCVIHAVFPMQNMIQDADQNVSLTVIVHSIKLVLVKLVQIHALEHAVQMHFVA